MSTIEQLDTARHIINAEGGRARMSTYTSTRHGTVNWRTAEHLARRSPAELQIGTGDDGARYIERRYQPQPRCSQPDRVIDMTAGPVWVQLVTPGGIVNVHTGLVTALAGLPAVTVEVAPSTREMPTSGDGGHWETEVRDYYMDRTDISMIRKEDI